ncbi:hypothetical protein F4814DRAFT_424182 [Daldinia grandis]|nr:hypothetical protein F4814DRAFT_424182 [Daldinia grandis]
MPAYLPTYLLTYLLASYVGQGFQVLQEPGGGPSESGPTYPDVDGVGRGGVLGGLYVEYGPTRTNRFLKTWASGPSRSSSCTAVCTTPRRK